MLIYFGPNLLKMWILLFSSKIYISIFPFEGEQRCNLFYLKGESADRAWIMTPSLLSNQSEEAQAFSTSWAAVSHINSPKIPHCDYYASDGEKWANCT